MSSRCTKQLSDGRWVAWQGTVLVESRFSEDDAHDRLDDAVADGQDQDEDNKIVAMLNLLREGEGHYVTVLCPNPDFDSPEQVVLAFGEWTGWQERRFVGDSLLEALNAAVEAMLEPGSPPETGVQPFPLPDPADRLLGVMVSLSAYGVPDSDILSALIGSAATCLGLILEADSEFVDQARESCHDPVLHQVLDGLAAIHRNSVETMAAANAGTP